MARTFLNVKNVPDLKTLDFVPRAQFKLFGDWEKTIKLLQTLDPKIKKASIAAQMHVCRQIAKRVKAHLVNQDLPWKPLNPKYRERKVSRGLDGRTLISWAEYYYAIKVWTSGNRHLANVGVKNNVFTRSVEGKKSRLSIAQIAMIHEFSSGRKIPKRPLWNPTLREMGGAKGIKSMYSESLVKQLRKLGVPVKDFKNYLR